jgi:membrane protein implicated in regulation of membrane protease activity
VEIEIWWIWMALAALFVVTEVFRKGSVFLWLSFSAAVSGILALLQIPLPGQIAVFINLSGILILLERRFSERYTFKPPPRSREAETTGALIPRMDAGTVDKVEENVFRRSGAVWQIKYAGASCTVKHSMGLIHIRNLIIKNGEWIPCSDLKRISSEIPSDSGYEPYKNMSKEQIEREHFRIGGDIPPETLISRLSLEKIRRLKEILIERKETDAFNSPEERIDQLNTLDFIEKYLKSVTDIKGRPRKILDRTDTDRKAVSIAINRCRNNLKTHKELYIHFTSFIQAEGNAFRYLPDRPIDWTTE